MKKLLFILIVFNLFSINAQTWRYSSSGNDFDGRYKISLITGNANNYPYNKPTLVINYFDKDDSLNFYISDAGYYSDSSDVEVLWVFNNEKDIIYETPALTLSSDGKSIFFEEFKSPKSSEYISIYEFINKLKTASNVSVRIRGKFDKNDIKFSLNGSTKAINYVISAEEIDLKINKIKIQREISKEKEVKKDSILNSIKIIKSKLRKISSNQLLRVEEIHKDSLIGERIKFLIDYDNNKFGYQSFGKENNIYKSLKYDDYKGRTATVVGLSKRGITSSSSILTYKLKMDDDGEEIIFRLKSYSKIPSNIGVISLLEKARDKYLGKTFYSYKYARIGDLESLQECTITKITFAEEDVKYAQLYGAFNVYYETKGNYSEYTGFEAEEKESKMVNINFTNTYSPLEGYNSNINDNKFFENIFYYVEEFVKPNIKE